jgi:hypothetical protein
MFYIINVYPKSPAAQAALRPRASSTVHGLFRAGRSPSECLYFVKAGGEIRLELLNNEREQTNALDLGR